MAEGDENTVRERLRSAIDKAGVDPTNLSKEIGRGKDYIRDFLDERKRSIGAAEAAAIERELKMPPGWLQHMEAVTDRWLAEQAPGAAGRYTPPPELFGKADLKVFASAEGGSGVMVVYTDPIDIVPRPWFMKGLEGYGVLVVGDSMEPEFEPGDTALVNPRLPLVRGKAAIFISQEHEGDFRASIKRLVRATETHWLVRQFNPAKEFKLSKTEWTKALRVVGKYGGG